MRGHRRCWDKTEGGDRTAGPKLVVAALVPVLLLTSECLGYGDADNEDQWF